MARRRRGRRDATRPEVRLDKIEEKKCWICGEAIAKQHVCDKCRDDMMRGT